jgi:hypothetical protein
MDIEKAKALSTYWDEVQKELDKWIANEFQKIKTCEPDQLKQIQARIAAFEEIKNLPQVVVEREEGVSGL